MRVCLLAIVLLVALRAAPATVNVPLPPESRATGNRLVLHFENLKLPPDSSGIVRVFADLPSADARTSTDDEHFLGYFTLVPKNSTEAARGIERASATLDLTAKKQRLAGKREVSLTIVPLGRPSLLPAVAPGSASTKPTFGRIYLSKE